MRFKKIIIITLVVLIIILLIILLLRKRNKPSVTYPTVTPTITRSSEYVPFIIPKEKQIEITRVKVNNFYQQAVKVNSDGDALITDKSANYRIEFLPKFNQFLIIILNPVFETGRNEAEKEFLKVLEIDKEEACRLTVEISVPGYVKNKYAGKTYPLSFCFETP